MFSRDKPAMASKEQGSNPFVDSSNAISPACSTTTRDIFDVSLTSLDSTFFDDVTGSGQRRKNSTLQRSQTMESDSETQPKPEGSISPAPLSRLKFGRQSSLVTDDDDGFSSTSGRPRSFTCPSMKAFCRSMRAKQIVRPPTPTSQRDNIRFADLKLGDKMATLAVTGSDAKLFGSGNVDEEEFRVDFGNALKVKKTKLNVLAWMNE